MMIYIQLFISFLQIGILSIGGGYAAIPIIQELIIEKHGWLTMSEFADLMTIAEMTPGPIAINSSSFVGIQVAGIPGAIIATFACVLPSTIIVIFLASMYKKYKNMTVVQGVLQCLRPAVVSLIASAGISMLVLAIWGEGGFNMNLSSIQIPNVILFGISLFLLKKYKVNPIYIMIGCGVVGGFLF